MRRRLSSAVTLVLLLGGCATWAPELPSSLAESPRTYHPTIEIAGRLTVRYEGRSGPEVLPGSFRWQQTPAVTKVTLLSPLGQTMAHIESSAAGATLLQAGQPARSAADVNALTAQALGWPLPVAGLRDWLQGFATDARDRRFIATPQTDSVVTADGWLVRFPNWEADASGTARPRRIDLSRRTPQAGEIGLRLVIDTWQPF